MSLDRQEEEIIVDSVEVHPPQTIVPKSIATAIGHNQVSSSLLHSKADEGNRVCIKQTIYFRRSEMVVYLPWPEMAKLFASLHDSDHRPPCHDQISYLIKADVSVHSVA